MAATAVSQPQGEYAEYTSAQRYLILIAVMLGSLMQIIDISIVNVAIPSMMGNLGATLEEIGWVSTGYIISAVIVLPLTGWLSARFGRRKYLFWSMVIFTVASFMCGMSRSLSMLIFWRVMQGVGGAALQATAQATLMEIFPPSQVGMMQAIFGIGLMAGPTVGPTLGGWLTDNYSWPWIFFINVPIGILAAFMTYHFMHDSRHQRRPSGGIDFMGIIFLAIGLGCLQTVLEKGRTEDWFQSSYIVTLTILAVIGVAGFIVWELKTPYPAVNLRVLRNRGLAAGTAFATVIGFALFGGIFILPVFLQNLLHKSANQTGWILFPGALASAVVMPLIGRLVTRFSARTLTAIGALGFLVSTLMLRNITLDTGTGDLYWPMILRGAAMGFTWIPLTLATLMGLHGKEMADGTGLFNLSRQLGGSAGIAYLTTYVAHQTDIHYAAMSNHVSLYNGQTVLRLEYLVQGFVWAGSPLNVAHQKALAAIHGTMMAQSSVMAFEDAFVMIALALLVSMPLLLLFKKGVPRAHASRVAAAE